MKKCKRCGTPFTPNRQNANRQSYCSLTCKRAVYRERRKLKHPVNGRLNAWEAPDAITAGAALTGIAGVWSSIERPDRARAYGDRDAMEAELMRATFRRDCAIWRRRRREAESGLGEVVRLPHGHGGERRRRAEAA